MATSSDSVESRKESQLPKRHFAFGIIFVILSIVLIIIGTLRIISYAHFPHVVFIGVGIWTGLTVIIPGLLSIFAFTNNSRKLLAFSLIVETIALMLMAVSVLFYYIELLYYFELHYYKNWRDDQNFQVSKGTILDTSSCIVSVHLIIHLAFGFQEFCNCCSKRKLLGHIASPVQYVNSTIRKPKVHLNCGVIFVISALLLIILEIIRVADNSLYQFYWLSGVGIWSGLFILIAGILSILAVEFRSRKWLASVLIMEFVALPVMAVAGIFCAMEEWVNVFKVHNHMYSRSNTSILHCILGFTYAMFGIICVVSITFIFHIVFLIVAEAIGSTSAAEPSIRATSAAEPSIGATSAAEPAIGATSAAEPSIGATSAAEPSIGATQNEI